jgi:hypothetical protein
MITACTVCIPGMEDLVELLIKSISANSSLISKILVAHYVIDKASFTPKIFRLNNIEIEHFDACLDGPLYSHALGLHECIDRVETDYILLTDPDLIFQLKNFDQFYFDLYHKYKLNIIGISHFNSTQQAYNAFPTVINCLVRKDTLPDKRFLINRLKIRPYLFGKEVDEDNYPSMNGKYLLQSPILEHRGKFPRPLAIFDVGCNLFLWNKEKNGRWISFIHAMGIDNSEKNAYEQNRIYTNCTTYNYNNNFDLIDSFGYRPLLYHSRLVTRKQGSLQLQYDLSNQTRYT